jgi:hypothetical protein
MVAARYRRIMLLATGCALVAAAGGCRAPGDLESPSPYERARAAVLRAEAGDAAAVHRLVVLLEDPDPAVRMYSILALERLCGTTYGYVYHADVGERAAAVARWQAALQAGEVRVRPDAAAGGSS